MTASFDPVEKTGTKGPNMKHISRVLIVDDDLINLIILEKMLDKLEHSVVRAESGFEALELVEKQDFALVLLDAQMPKMDGFETAKRIRSSEKNKELPIIFVSALNKDRQFVLKGYESGAVDYLIKPLDDVLLKSKVEIFCKLHEQKKILEEKNTELANLNSQLHKEIEKREEAEKKLIEQAIRDPLTGLFNRRYLEESLEREISKTLRDKTVLSVLMLDADHFKNFNDSFGHLAGDLVLRELSTLLLKYSRKEDIACRYGGEEFVLVLPGTTTEVAVERAEVLRATVENQEPLSHHGQILPNVTVSIGVATLPHHGTDIDEILSTADDALYEAKNKGRNRIETATILKKKQSQPSAAPC